MSLAAAVLPQVEALAPQRRLSVPISPDMLTAGRRAFLKQRGKLGDLWDFYDCDLESALRHIFREMVRARG